MQSTNLVPDAISHNSVVMGVVLRELRIGWSKCRAPILGPDAISHNSVIGVVLRELPHRLEQMQSTNLVPDAISHNSVMGVRIGWSRCRAPILFLMQSATTLSWGLC